MPNKVKVGGVHYTVEEQDNLITTDEAWGRIFMHNSSIVIDSSLSKERKKQTFIHELTHAIFLEAGYKEQDEDMINRLSIVLNQVLHDNREFFGKFGYRGISLAEKLSEYDKG